MNENTAPIPEHLRLVGPAPVPVPFTDRDRAMLADIHAAITQIASVANDVLPMLQGSPVARMLGIR